MATLSDFLCEWDNSSPFIVAHTSGSTGTPKEIHLLKEDMRRSARATNSFFGIDSNSVLGIPLSMDYIAGKMMAVRAIEAHCRLLELPVSNRIELPEDVDLLSVVPSQAADLLDNDPSLKRAGCLLIGGAPLDISTEQRLFGAGVEAYVGYGMTETCSHVALRRVGESEGIYRAMPGISFTRDERNCLVITSGDFSWKTLITNDIVDLIDGQSFRWLGRADNVIISGGIKIHPEQVEQAIASELGQGSPDFYITSEQSTRWGQQVVMIAETSGADLENLRASVAAMKLPTGWRPAAVKGVERLPRTSNGKIRR